MESILTVLVERVLVEREGEPQRREHEVGLFS